MGSIIQMRQTEAERQRTCSGVHGSFGFDAFLLVSKFEKIRTDSRSLKVPESVCGGVFLEMEETPVLGSDWPGISI